MDFFANQRQARQQTGWLLLLFLLAVAGILLSLNLLGAIVYALHADVRADSVTGVFLAIPGWVYAAISIVALFTIFIGSAIRMSSLATGGSAVAKRLGARRAKPSRETVEDQLLNVVQEMAIASGVRMPAVYILDAESSINACAAGFSPNEAALIVTRGALLSLNRDELQGVVAHEFSHILNGDMRLNLRLIGIIAGIVFIGDAGRVLMRTRGGRNPLPILGFFLWLIGLSGLLFASLIKAAVSRQREFLADAAAVQFTRHPEGLAGALCAINARGSVLHGAYAEEVSHMAFGMSSESLFSTHPEISVRLQRILGRRAASFQRESQGNPSVSTPPPAQRSVPELLVSPIPTDLGVDGTIPFESFKDASVPPGPTLSPTAVMDSLGTLNPFQISRAHTLLAALPPEIMGAMKTRGGALAALFALLIKEGEFLDQQQEVIRAAYASPLAEEAIRFARLLRPLGPSMRLPIFDLVQASLADEPESGRRQLVATLEGIARADGTISLGEFILLTLSRRHFENPVSGQAILRSRRLPDSADVVVIVLSLLGNAAHSAPAAYARAFAALSLTAETPLAMNNLNATKIENALETLRQLVPEDKSRFFRVCLELVVSSHSSQTMTAELIRTVGAALDIPVPLFMTGMEHGVGSIPAVSPG